MRTLIITTLAVGLIGCATQPPKPQVLLRIVDPYSLIVYELTNAPCPYQFNNYPYAFTYQGTLQGCYDVNEAQQNMRFISSVDWKTRVIYTFTQLIEAKRVHESLIGYALQNVKPSYVPQSPAPSMPSQPPMIQCFTNGFGTITCN